MKRKIDEISNENQGQIEDATPQEQLLYGNEVKKRKLNEQKIGDFIVDAKKVFHLRLTSDLNKLEDESATSKFFAPFFMHQMFGQEERISGYEGLSVDITLSKKRLIPFLQMTYEQKAPAFANIDNVQEKLEKHYGRIYDKPEDFIKILREEETYKPMGEKIKEIKMNQKSLEVYKVSLENEAFHEQNFYLQALLPFFIDGASMIEPSPFWQYFLIYDQETNDLLAYASVFEAHHTADKFRAKISQVLVLPPYQKQGLGNKLYQVMFEHYRLAQEKCFQVIVEDSADDFQRIQDVVNSQVYFDANQELRKYLSSLPIANVVLNVQQFKQTQPTKSKVQEYSTLLKLPEPIILRVHDLILYSLLDQNEQVQKAFRLLVKKRFYIRCVRDYLPLFKGIDNNLLAKQGGLCEPYIYNSELEENPFQREFGKAAEEVKKEDNVNEQEKLLTQEGLKIQLKTIFAEVVNEYEAIKPKIKKYISEKP